MGCGVYWKQVREVERALGFLRRLGFTSASPSYREIFSLQGKLRKQIGLKLPRTVSMILKLVGLSPGTLTLWHDVESGWMSEARARPGAPPVYKAASDEVAAAIIKGEVTHELEERLLDPDVDIDN